MKEIQETSALLSAILRVMHPALYDSGRQTLTKLSRQANLDFGLRHWSSVFNAVTVLSNRSTPFHWDNYSQAQWYDMLVTVGPYTPVSGVLANSAI